MHRIKITIRGAVQGVGFRPFVYKLANQLNLKGWVINSSIGVLIEAEGSEDILNNFLEKIISGKPPRSFIQSLEHSFLDPVGYTVFEIRFSEEEGSKTVLILPDIATCNECLNDIYEISNRRYLYPFTNCTNCGPRFSIIEKLPYDRPNTSMKNFLMCDKCKDEYQNPLDRRFHAQPIACPDCGPQLMLWDAHGKILAEKHDALLKTVSLIKGGKIAAVKGLGGFHLLVNAQDNEAVVRLRSRKHREEKPFALMYPDIALIEADCYLNTAERRLLQSPESPIVLLEKKNTIGISGVVAPQNPYLGVMLPYTPLHHLLMRESGTPLVATSGNLSDEPICTDENESLKRLKNIADVFLVHNRPIVRHVDDSIVRIFSGREFVIRRARGYAPLPVSVKEKLIPALAVGAHLKNSISMSVGKNIFISQHIGDLETEESFNAFTRVIRDFQKMYEVTPKAVISDLHPDYLSTNFAQKMNLPVYQIQHHYAHILSCMAENEIEDDVLGVSWDGTGYGTDNTIWGGEFFLINKYGYKRFAHLKQFRLPGGEIAIKEIWRTAYSVLKEVNLLQNEYALPIFDNIAKEKIKLIDKMIESGINSPITSSMGRLFDAVSYLSGISNYSYYEGQSAMQLEFAIGFQNVNESYPFSISENSKHWKNDKAIIIDWKPLIKSLLDEKKSQDKKMIAVKFHNTLTQIILEASKRSGLKKIVLSGGCFQNKYLTEKTIALLSENGFKTYWHQRVPANDGGISLGQISAFAKNMKGSL